ncbi:hypothetical protein ABF176_001756 [Flavobacterium psychrophilum]|uniref:Uncharacterized protein n=1 Tax=Flavobacterium psychrophilum TaxID=96345 RepID=A0A7U2NFQ6_FLAPS|nr:hypothetical protein [Flavobacterium psychrophilum]EKT4519120.1 hypothetical protein [Flavobacterium psychrophilum]QRE04133.1 hypothetical protein H0H26_00550 [Flavobacterium psychrophilum]SNB06450.1 putative lipoprotein [Flavobacterium psychrophilum]
MKTIALVFLSLLLTKSCQPKKESGLSQQTKETIDNNATPEVEKPEKTNNKVQTGTKAEYEAFSRGFFSKITFENNQLTISSDRNNPEKVTIIVLTKNDISDLSNLIKAVNLDQLPSLKSPSEARMYDGAAHANLTITSGGTVYTGAGFDAGKPPVEIEKLVSKLVSYSEKK